MITGDAGCVRPTARSGLEAGCALTVVTRLVPSLTVEEVTVTKLVIAPALCGVTMTVRLKDWPTARPLVENVTTPPLFANVAGLAD